MARKAWQLAARAGSRGVVTSQHTGRRQATSGMGLQNYKAQLKWVLPPSRLGILNVPKPHQTAPPTGHPVYKHMSPLAAFLFFFFPNDNGLSLLLNTIPLIIYSLPIARRKGFGLGRWLGRESVYRSRGSHWSSDPSTLINTIWTWCPSVIPSPKRQRNGF